MSVPDLIAAATAVQHMPAPVTPPTNEWAKPQTFVAVLSMVVAAYAYFNASAARKEVKIARRHERTDKHVEAFRAPMMRTKRDWVEKELAAFNKKHGLGQNCGLSAMRVGTPIKLKASDGSAEVLTGGEIAQHVMENLDDMARDMRHGRLDNHMVMQALGPGIISAWKSLDPYMPGRWSSEYFHYTGGRWSIRSLVKTIAPYETVDERVDAIRARWGYEQA